MTVGFGGRKPYEMIERIRGIPNVRTALEGRIDALEPA
jgi:hypothetical protein